MSTTEGEGRQQKVDFFKQAEGAFRTLFERAKVAHELHFAMALHAEMRGLRDAGWSTASEANRAFDDYMALLDKIEPRAPVRLRVLLSLYVQLSEGSGFWETPK